MTQFNHQAVLLSEATDALNVQQQGIYIDGTFGRGGHSQVILDKLGENGRLIVFDQDVQAIEHAREQYQTDTRVHIEHKAFSHMLDVVEKLNITQQVDGILLDLGVSSPQLDDAQRGFSFMQSGELDMRMNTQSGISAQEWVNTVSMQEMADAFKRYGEERYAKRIAQHIIKAREKESITDTLQLAEIIKLAHPRWEKHKHPATRCFQAIRITVNQELQELEKLLEQLLSMLKPGGRIAIISFHSLEDRIVKQFFKKMSTTEELPFELPIMHSDEQVKMRRVGKMIKASKDELDRNPRSRSAVLRIAEVV